MNSAQKWGLGSGLIIFVVLLLLPPPAGMALLAWRAAALVILMAILWMTEALPHRTMHLGPGQFGHAAQSCKIDMRRQVVRARRVKGVGKAMAFDRLKRLAKGWAIIAIIDDQGGPALRCQPLGQGPDNGNARRAAFNDASRGCVPQRLWHQIVWHGLSGDWQEHRVLTGNAPFMPMRRPAHELINGKRIKKFIGDDQKRCVIGQGGNIVMPDRTRHGGRL